MEKEFYFSDSSADPVEDKKTGTQTKNVYLPPEAVIFFGDLGGYGNERSFIAYLSEADEHAKTGKSFRFQTPADAFAAACTLALTETIAEQTVRSLIERLRQWDIDVVKVGSVYYTATGAAAALLHQAFQAEKLTDTEQLQLQNLADKPQRPILHVVKNAKSESKP